MYWWNVSHLASDFQEGRVEERERFKYYLATSIVTSVGVQACLYYGQEFKVLYLISGAVMISITVIGTVLCYRANRSGDNTDFIGRMVCLSWPIGIKVLALFLGIVLAFGVVVFVATLVRGSEILSDAGWEILGEVGGAAAVVCIYWLLYKYVTLIAHAKGTESAN